ncbi:MAG: hypothetical protein LHW43_07885, partial [Candidatus Cloacimonetes bacterium]|nr:hypothetical protein [Candidatus Cloacimonadota bacterium]
YKVSPKLAKEYLYRVTQNFKLSSLGHLAILLYVVLSYEDVASDLDLDQIRPFRMYVDYQKIQLLEFNETL